MNGHEDIIYFKDWLPDTPDLGRDALTDVEAALPYDGSYHPYLPLLGLGGVTTPGLPIGAYYPSALIGPTTFSDEIHAGFQNALYVYSGIGSITNRSGSTYSSSQAWNYAQFDDLVIAVNGVDTPQARTIGSGNFSNLSTTGLGASVPAAGVVGVVNRFVMIGNLGGGGESWLQWSSIDSPRDWQTLGSATASARQSSLQKLPKELGRVNGIFGGDQIAIIMQDGGVTRCQYVGGSIVFQFDTISRSHGASYGRGSIQIKNLVYFISNNGFQVTDGVSIVPIGDGKVDHYFHSNFFSTFANRLSVCHDPQHNLIIWGWPDFNASGGQPNRILVYNYEEKRWSKAPQLHERLFSPPPVFPSLGPFGFVPDGANTEISRFLGFPLTAEFTTAEAQLIPGSISRVKSVRPLISVTSGSISNGFVEVQIGTKMNEFDTITFGAASTLNSYGECPFRSEARFHKAKLSITGYFKEAIGLQCQFEKSGAR